MNSDLPICCLLFLQAFVTYVLSSVSVSVSVLLITPISLFCSYFAH